MSSGAQRPPDAEDRLPVAKSYQLYVGGAFPRSESGRVYPVTDHRGTFLANAAQASRRDARDAVIAAGNTAVVVASQHRPLPAVTLSEVFASSDLPGGVVNVLTGRTAELAPWLAAHADVNALDLGGAPPAISADLERTAAGTVKRVLPAPAAEPDWTRTPDTRRLRAFVEIKTDWGASSS